MPASQVLTSNGIGAAPTFQAAGGGLTLITDTVISGDPATVDFTGFSAATYGSYIFVLEGVLPAQDLKNMLIRTSTDGGVGYDAGASDYAWAAFSVDSVGTRSGDGSTANAEIETTVINDVGNVAGEEINIVVHLYRPEAALVTSFSWNLFYKTSSSKRIYTSGGGQRLSAGDVDAVRFLWSGGVFANVGRIKFYGITE